MSNGKQSMQQSGSANGVQSSSATGTTHNVFLNLRLEPFFSSSIMDMLDILVHPVTMSPSVPSTPPPTYEPPPPSYPSSDAWSISSMSSLSLDRVNDAISVINDNDSAISAESDYFIRHNDTCSSIARSGYNINTSSMASNNSNGSNGSSSRIGGAPELQSQLILNLVVYELLTGRQHELSRSPSMDSVI
ncbi:hypothetical protein GGI25_000839 [Coemansia spiralis]|uniref:Uncharacterized protein n=2 Tax=Coemansia TaxID=4863 RepID=A0A9W8L0X6_9FUNG|nr:hypothetical protein BX070DRAFT_234018 [Coemansia spiralis]KAJ1994125.1 hypothetical protein EDC05_001795 [Coemansia umbellata]KAJ2623576.1 hypothetical protein GGI26_002214 [Coemansia sp. RSA 1358]KAJ2680246.1 hypothetical protein GGI25_000839 [Coemansia spiralis]